MPSNLKKTVIEHNRQTMVSASWLLMRVRELKAKGNSVEWAAYNRALTHVSTILKREITRSKWNEQRTRGKKVHARGIQP